MSQDLAPVTTRARHTTRGTSRRTVAGSQPRRSDRSCSASVRRAEDIKWAKSIGLTIVFTVLGIGAVVAQALDGASYNVTAALVRIVALAVFVGGSAAIILVPAKVGRIFRPTDR